MDLSPDACYRALTSRDARFDGRFFIGVRSTGVYCRPICPVRTPLRRNITFYPCAAAAAEAGFRPCLRCRPETAPGTPAWRGTSATVSRALQLIGEGALDRGGIPELADRVGIGERHLRRLFDLHVGASPVSVAQTRRIHFAKKLLNETRLPMTEVASAAGFSSLRRFNTAMRETYGRAPRELRRGRGSRPETEDSSLQLRLDYRPPFDWPAMMSHLQARALPGVEQVDADVYVRSIEIGGMSGRIEVGPAQQDHAVMLRVPARFSRHLMGIVERVRRSFDLAADPAEIQLQLGRDPMLRKIMSAHTGLRVPGAWDGFETAVRAILGQQVSVAGATTLAGRLARQWGEKLDDPRGEVVRTFPRPERLARVDLTRLGVVRTRARAIRTLSREVAAGRIQLDASADVDQTCQALLAIPGIGPWTVQVVAMRALRDPDSFPAGDLGLRRAFELQGQTLDAAAIEARAEGWRPWRAYAAVALWRFEGLEATRRLEARRGLQASSTVDKNSSRLPSGSRQ